MLVWVAEFALITMRLLPRSLPAYAIQKKITRMMIMMMIKTLMVACRLSAI